MTTPNMQFLGSDGNPASNPDIPKSLRDNIYTGTEVKALDSGLTAETLKAQLAGDLELPFHIDVVGFIEAAAERVFGFLMELGKTVIGGAVDFLSGAGKAIWDFGGAVFDAIGSGLRWAEDRIKRFLGMDTTPPPPPPPIISPILTDFEALVMPVAEKTKQTLEDIAIIDAEIAALEDEAARAISQSETAVTNAQSAIDQLEAAKISLAADAKEALDRATASIAEAQAATQMATSTANALAEADTRLANAAQGALLEAASALVVAEKGVADAKALNDRLPAIEADIATADDRINEVDLRLSNEVAGALSKAEQGIADAKAASDKLPGINNEIATLGMELGKVSGDLDASVQAVSALDTRLTKAASDAQAKADQATLDAESKATAAREAAELYAKEKSEADAAQALVDAKAEAARVAQEAAAQAVLDSASDADAKVALAESALKAYAEAQAAAAKEAAEATAAADATAKANQAKTDAEKEAKRLSDLAAAAAAAAQSTANQAKAAADVAVTNTVVEYAVGASETTAPTTGWSTSTPTRTPGSFVWMRSRITYGSGTTTVTSPALLTGNTGAQGAPGTKGADGLPGKDGVGVKTTTVTYVTSTSGTTAPTSGWTAAVPTLTKGRYLWTKTLWTYTDNSTETGYSVAYVAKDGSSGTDGLPGKDGVGITNTAITYAKSSSGTVAPTSGWAAQPPATSPGDFMWTRTVWTYSDKTTETGYTVGKIGNTGAKGATGATGGKGDQGVSVTSVTPYYRLVTKGATAPATPTTATPSGWTTTEPGYVADRELFRADKAAYSNGAFTWTDVSRVSAYTAASQANDKIPGMQDSITTAHSKAEAAQSSIDNLQIGGRNLLLASNPKSGKTSGYPWGRFTLTEPLTEGEIVTISIKGTLPEGRTAWRFYNSGGSIPVASIVAPDPSGITTWTGPWSVGSSANTYLNVYCARNTTEHREYPGEAYVEWIKLERGSKAADWTPAPEDAQAEINSLIIRADDLTTGLSQAATQEQYNQLNTRLWGAQGELNKVNSAMWDTQTGWNATQAKLNKATSDSLAALNNYTKINNDLWGAQGEFNRIATEYQQHSTEIDKAQNAAIRALSRPDLGGSLLGYVEPEGTSTEWVPAWTTAAWGKMDPTHDWVTSLPITADVYWASSAQGSKRSTSAWVKADPNLEYKVTFWARGGGRIYASLHDRSLSNVVASGGINSDGTNNSSSYLVSALDLPSSWQKFETVITLKPGTTDVSFGTVWWNHTGKPASPQAIAGLTISPNTPSQEDVNEAQSVVNELRAADWADQKKINAAKLTIDNAQNQAISANTRLLNMVFPAQSLVPIYADGNIPAWEQQCLFLANGAARDGVTRETVDVPPGVKSAIKVVATGTKTISPTSYAMVAADPGIQYKYSFWAKADTPGTKIYVELRDQDGDQDGDHAIQTNKPVRVDGAAEDEPHGGNAPYIAHNLTLPTVWTKHSGTITLKSSVRQVRIGSIYWSHSNGTPGTQYLADLQIYPNMPSQFEVDAAQTTAIAANVEATKALQTATRMAFPDISLVPTPGTNNKPAWPGSVAGSATNLPPGMAIRLLPDGKQDANSLSYSRTGTGTFAGLTGSTAFFSSDVYDADGRPVLSDMDLKLSFWAKVSAGSGTVSVRLKNESGGDVVTHVKPIQLDDDGNFKGWAAGTVATTSPELVSGTWMKYTYALRLKSNPGKLRIEVSTTADPTSALVTVWGLHMSVYFPGQEEVDLAQNEASRALQDVANLRGRVTTLEIEKSGMQEELATAQQTASEALARSIPRHLFAEKNATTYDPAKTDWKITANSSGSTFTFEALSDWVGTAIVQCGYSGGFSSQALVRIPLPDGARTFNWGSNNYEGTTRTIRSAIVTYFMDTLVQQKPPATVDTVKWLTTYSTSASPTTATKFAAHDYTFLREAQQAHIKFVVGWDAATNGDYYGIRIVRHTNGVATILGTHRISGLGPVFPWGDGYREMSLTYTGTIPEGSYLSFEAWSSASSSSQRVVRKSTVTKSWLEKPTE